MVGPPARRPEPARTIAFCADDVGLVAGVSDVVAGLAAAGRLAAASCVTTAAGWPAEGRTFASATAALPGFELGLHLNLTEGVPLSADLGAVWPALPSLPRLIALAHAGRLPLAAVAAEVRAQLDAYAGAIGRPPDFVDGHRHVHHLPGVRDVLLSALLAWPGAPPAVRDTGRVTGPGHAFKRLLVERTGGRSLHALLNRLGMRRNGVLLGAYDFSTADYGRLVRGWLAAAPDRGGLVFCHPGPGQDADPIGAARRREAAYLGSGRFGADLAAAGFRVGPSWVRSSSAG